MAFEVKVNMEYSFLPCHSVVKLRTLVTESHGMMRSEV